MLFRTSVWYPDSRRSIAVLVMLAGMVVLHFTELFGLLDAGLLFGWLPMQFAYDLAYTVLAVVLLYGVYRMAPDGTAKSESGTSGVVDGTRGEME
ncbi:hypothetical protein [Halarchaeum nitratireducens]|uniref:Uncharacterized protein n=1 Tax=Halarchaeum nitratireducens TaxID=489913 RepID=A0A830G920_9EURY|nr:hypothetical protein [Halarchaeum nitratireducens]GGN10367.1 hypothetical protein GCM10009021_07720 [Halarchaeum nitratireducens]